MELLEYLVGTWVAAAEGAYVLEAQFMRDETVCFRIDGELLLSNTFALVTSEMPYRLDISRLDEHQQPSRRPLECIVLPEGSDRLHLCCAAVATDPRPTTFSGPGYVRMTRCSL